MPRKKKLDAPVEWKVNVPTSIAAQVEILLSDPLTGRTAYGARSTLISKLLSNWVANQKRQEE